MSVGALYVARSLWEKIERALRHALTADLAALGEQAGAHAATLSWGPIATRTAESYAGSVTQR